MPAFRFSARSVLLTYSQVSEAMTKEAVYHTIDDRYVIRHYVIGEEKHADGGRHIHACLIFANKIDSSDATLFDINDGQHQFHPNIQPIKHGRAHMERAQEYCRKEDNEPLQNVEAKLSWGEILEKAQHADDYMRLVRTNYPRDYCLNFQRLEALCAKLWPKSSINTITSFNGTYVMEMPNALSTITVLPSNQSIVVVGPAGCGKTTWAKMVSPKPCLFVRHLDSLSDLREYHQAIIFDDLDFAHLPPSTQKFLVDVENLAEIHIRYRVAKIPAGIKRIFTANTYPFSQGGPHGRAIERRIVLIDL